MTETRHFVLNGHTLGYVQEDRPQWFGVHQGDPFLGGHDWKNGPVHLLDTDDLKPADLADFERFRVCPKGHIA